MQQLRIRPRSLRRVITSRSPQANGEHQIVRISDGEAPDNWVLVKMEEEIHNKVKYDVIEVLEWGKNARITFFAPSPT